MSGAREALADRDAATAARLAPILGGLEHARTGGSFDGEGRAPRGRRLLGWSATGHWLRPPTRPGAERVG